MPSAAALNGSRGYELSLSFSGNYDYIHVYMCVCMWVSIAEALRHVAASALRKE